MNNIDFFGENNGKIYFLEDGEKKYVTEEEKDKLFLGYIYNKKGELEKTPDIIEREKQEKLKNLRNDFDFKLDNFLSSYPKGIRETFTLRSDEANKYLTTGKSDYITNLVKQKNIDRKANGLALILIDDFVNKIIVKSIAFSNAYNKLESWYDLEKENIINN